MTEEGGVTLVPAEEGPLILVEPFPGAPPPGKAPYVLGLIHECDFSPLGNGCLGASFYEGAEVARREHLIGQRVFVSTNIPYNRIYFEAGYDALVSCYETVAGLIAAGGAAIKLAHRVGAIGHEEMEVLLMALSADYPKAIESCEGEAITQIISALLAGKIPLDPRPGVTNFEQGHHLFRAPQTTPQDDPDTVPEIPPSEGPQQSI